MGYYTTFEMQVEGSGPVYDKLMKESNKVLPGAGDGYDFSLARILEYSVSEIKWYEFEPNMIELSNDWPNVLFIVDGTGEEAGDVWRAWFRNGKMHKIEAKVVFEQFTPDLDALMPIDKDLEKRILDQQRKDLEQKLAMLQKEQKALEDTIDKLNFS